MLTREEKDLLVVLLENYINDIGHPLLKPREKDLAYKKFAQDLQAKLN